MKFLSVCFANHDSNISYFDGKELHYHKLERTSGYKRDWYTDLWTWIYDVEKLWGVNVNDVDEIVFQIENSIFQSIEHLVDEETKTSLHSMWRGNSNTVELGPEFKQLTGIDKNIYAISHYYAHALSTHVMTDTKPDVYIAIDAYGDWIRSWSVFRDDKLIDMGLFNEGSLGVCINDMGAALGIKHVYSVDIAGKLMGLQSYGHLDQAYLNLSKDYEMKDVCEFYSYERYCQYKGDVLVTNLSMLDWARTIHEQTSGLLVKFFKKYANHDDVVFYSGGVAQNVIWNTELRKHFPKLVIPPHSNDEGISLGGIEWLRRKNNLPPIRLKNYPYCQSDVAPKSMISDDKIVLAAKLLADGKTVGWYQGHGELGPRALGNRSIFMDPRIPNGRAHINEIKMRENYRPFGASVLKEHLHDYFDADGDDPYMLYTAIVKRKGLESITHVDGTCRVQTVDDSNPEFRKLLLEFYKLTGCPVLLNTSLNLAGQSLVGYPEAAIQILADTKLDSLFVGDQHYYKDKFVPLTQVENLSEWKQGAKGYLRKNYIAR